MTDYVVTNADHEFIPSYLFFPQDRKMSLKIYLVKLTQINSIPYFNDQGASRHITKKSLR